ncbi:MAG TPA: efflux RND transporter permease subunit, partial [Clostridia bacterium]
TVTPMMSSRLFKNKKTKGRIFSGFNKYMDGLEEKLQESYGKLLSWSLKHRWVVALVVVALLGLSVSFIITGRIGTEFMPYTDEGQYTVNLKLDPGTAIGITDSKTKQVEEYVSKIPETDYIRSQVGFSSDGNGDTNQASVLVKMVEKSKRKRSQKEVVEEVRHWGKALTGVDLSVTEPSMGDGGTGGGYKPININVKGTDTNVLNEISQQVVDIAKKTSGVIEVGSSFEQGKPSYDIKVDKVSAAMYGISSYDISNTVRSGIEGVKSGTYSVGRKDYDVRVKLSGNSIKDINDLNNLYITGSTGNQIQLGQLAKVSLADSPVVIRRLDKQRVLTISANVQQGHTLGEVTGNIQKNVDKLKLPDGYSISLSGEQQNMNDTFTSLIQVLVLSLLLLYIILGVLYESFLTPLVRLLALPVGIIGALSMLAITGKSLNMMSMIGIIMLDGLAAKNGTILIDFTNGLMEKGMELRDALLVAGKTRLKPILMTSFAMIVGMLPTALSFGDGSEFKSSMALVIIGGMFTSTILSPLLIPVAYTYLDDFRLALKRFFKGLTTGSASVKHNEEKSWVFKEGENEL